MNWLAEATPVPVSITVCGLPVALSEIVTAPVSVSIDLGKKVTLIVQLPPAGTELPQLLFCVKSPALAPVATMPVMFKAALPMLTSWTFCAALVTRKGWLPRFRLVAERLTLARLLTLTVNSNTFEAPPPDPGFVTTTA
jgi:hypothetical protein